MSGNVDLFVRVLTQIEKHPETWEQATWCGTSQCVAGWACELAGEPATNYNGAIGAKAARLLEIALHSDAHELFIETIDETKERELDNVYRVSARILGLDETVLRDKVAAEVADGQVQP